MTPSPRRVPVRRFAALGAGVAIAALLAASGAASWAAADPAAATTPAARAPDSGGETTAQESSPEGEGGDPIATDGGKAADDGAQGGIGDLTEADYLTALGLVEGHLRAAVELAAADQRMMAVTHAEHPGDEIQGALGGALEARGAESFAPELDGLVATLRSDAAVADVEAANAVVLEAIAAARSHASGDAGPRLSATVNLARIAAQAYDAGVVDGAIADLLEYQDAWGFVQIARDQLHQIAASNDPEAAAVAAEMLSELGAAEPLFPSIVPEGEITGPSSLLWGAAARMEFAALPVTRPSP